MPRVSPAVTPRPPDDGVMANDSGAAGTCWPIEMRKGASAATVTDLANSARAHWTGADWTMGSLAASIATGRVTGLPRPDAAPPASARPERFKNSRRSMATGYTMERYAGTAGCRG